MTHVVHEEDDDVGFFRADGDWRRANQEETSAEPTTLQHYFHPCGLVDFHLTAAAVMAADGIMAGRAPSECQTILTLRRVRIIAR